MAIGFLRTLLIELVFAHNSFMVRSHMQLYTPYYRTSRDRDYKLYLIITDTIWSIFVKHSMNSIPLHISQS